MNGKPSVGLGEAYPGNFKNGNNHTRNLTDINNRSSANKTNTGMMRVSRDYAQYNSMNPGGASAISNSKKLAEDLNSDIIGCLTKSKEELMRDYGYMDSRDNPS